MTSTDARGTSTQYTYADQPYPSGATPLSGLNSFAFPATITNAARQTAILYYDYFLGKITKHQDPNSTITTVDYNDLFDRPTSSIHAAGLSGVAAQTVYG